MANLLAGPVWHLRSSKRYAPAGLYVYEDRTTQERFWDGAIASDYLIRPPNTKAPFTANALRYAVLGLNYGFLYVPRRRGDLARAYNRCSM